MGSDGVVVDTPSLNNSRASASDEKACSLRHSSRSRPLKLSTKAFWIGLLGAMWCHSIPVFWVKCRDRVADQFRAVVRDDHARPTAPGHDVREFTHDTSARERCVDHSRQAFAGESKAREAKSSTMFSTRKLRPSFKAVGHGVEAPALVLSLRDRGRRPDAKPAFGRRACGTSIALLDRADRPSSGSGAVQATVLQPFVTLARRHRQDALRLARQDRQSFDPVQCL